MAHFGRRENRAVGSSRLARLFLGAAFLLALLNTSVHAFPLTSRPFAFALSAPNPFSSTRSAAPVRRVTSLNSYIPGAINLLAGSFPSSTSDAAAESPAESQIQREKRMQKVTELVSSPVFVFMKGTPEAPQCGYSNAVIQMLRACGVSAISHFDVLADEEVRTGAKELANWETFPQVYVKGQFIGGADIVASMFKDGSLKTLLEESGVTSTPAEA